MKSSLVLILTCIWLFTIFAPSALILVSDEAPSFISFNPMEEDQEEQIDQDFDEEIVFQKLNDLTGKLNSLKSFLILSPKGISFRPHILEIFLPPPK
ncbi:MAG: hypothetical protein WBN69_05860 [Eudoraea sp.]